MSRLNLTHGKIQQQIAAITEKTFPLPRQEMCLPIGDMERALVEHAHELVLAVYADCAEELAAARAELAANEDSEDARLAVAEREVERLRAEVERLLLAGRRVSLAQGHAEQWADSTDVVLASAGRALLNTLGGAR